MLASRPRVELAAAPWAGLPPFWFPLASARAVDEAVPFRFRRDDEILGRFFVEGELYGDFLFAHGRGKVDFKSSHGRDDDSGAWGDLAMV